MCPANNGSLIRTFFAAEQMPHDPSKSSLLKKVDRQTDMHRWTVVPTSKLKEVEAMLKPVHA